MIRENTINVRDFSVVLAFTRRNGPLFRLRRYNGLHGSHTNHIEGQEIKGCHIHVATERYQIAGRREDAYAVVSSDFTDTGSALRLMFSQCAFKVPDPKAERQDDSPQMKLISDK
jgi:hypothetical protein